MNFTSGIFPAKHQVSTKIRYCRRQVLRIVLTLFHLRALHDVRRETFFKLKMSNNEM